MIPVPSVWKDLSEHAWDPRSWRIRLHDLAFKVPLHELEQKVNNFCIEKKGSQYRNNTLRSNYTLNFSYSFLLHQIKWKKEYRTKTTSKYSYKLFFEWVKPTSTTMSGDCELAFCTLSSVVNLLLNTEKVTCVWDTPRHYVSTSECGNLFPYTLKYTLPQYNSGHDTKRLRDKKPVKQGKLENCLLLITNCNAVLTVLPILSIGVYDLSSQLARLDNS